MSENDQSEYDQSQVRSPSTAEKTSAKRSRLRALSAILLTVAAFGLFAVGAGAVTGQSHGVTTLPMNGSCSVAGAYDGDFYITTFNASCTSTQLGIYDPPVTGAGAAVLVSSKQVVDSVTGAPVVLSAVDWDTSRNLLWGVHGTTSGRAYLIDLGNKAVSGPAIATLQFTYNIPGIPLIDGLAWDFTDDTLWISPDVDCDVEHFSVTGTNLGAIQPKNAAGVADCTVSGVAIGAANTLYISRNGTGEIRRVSKADGSFVSGFATANFRVEDMVCSNNTHRFPPVVGTPVEVLLVKDAFGQSYEAFEVEAGTCPAPTQACPDEDGDDDGMNDDSESLFGNLLNDSDTDDDGILDGNDDGNGNGVDDEDEDDDDGDDDDDCPDDSDGDGEDDEDEDDDEDDD